MKELNEFYSIADSDDETRHEFQLKDLGERRIWASIGKVDRSGSGEESYSTHHHYIDVNSEDYDHEFATKILEYQPTYEVERLLNYHLKAYLSTNNRSKKKFIKHIRYVVLQLLRKKTDTEVQVELVEQWLDEIMGTSKKETPNINIGNINSPAQIQINSDGSNQTQENQYSNEDVLELLKVLKKDLCKLTKEQAEELNLEIKSTEIRVNKGKNIKNKLFNIGEIIKEVGPGMFLNLSSSYVFEIMKPFIGM